MNRFACLMITGLVLAAGPRSSISASFPPLPAGDVEILVGDAAQPRYAHAGRWYVEARKGSEYAIRLGGRTTNTPRPAWDAAPGTR